MDENGLVRTQPIYAGQNLTDGTVTCDGTTGVLSINLGSWSLQDRAESVKVQCYHNEGELPSTRPEAGHFTTYKGTELTVPDFNCNLCRYIAIHLDVQQCTQ